MGQTAGITDFSSQRPAIDIRPWALTRHVTFRLPFTTNPRFEVEDVPREVRWKDLCELLAKHVHELRKRHHRQGEPHRVEFVRPTSEVLEGPLCFTLDRTAVIPITCEDERRYRMRVRVDVYTEICSLTYIIDSIAPNCAHLAKRLHDLDAAERDLPNSVRTKEEALRWLYDDVWSLNSPVEAAKTAQALFESEADRPGVPLTDFRGIVLDIADQEGEWAPKEKDLHPRLRQFLRDHDNLIHIAAGRHPEIHQSPVSGEPVCCGMLDGAAIYVAELGRRSPGVRIEPVRHLLVFAGSTNSQVGRLVRRLHVLGEFRHAALLDYDNEDDIDLKRVSRTLRGLGRKVDEVFMATPKERIEKMPELIADLSVLRANTAETGTLYRIEQSRYYAGEFKHTLRHLRSVRITNWQTYDDFVARYIFQLFARIDRVGSRYDGLMRRLGLLTTFSLATEISGYQSNVTEALGKLDLATKDLSRAARSQIGVSEKQRSLLHEASFIALAFLSYYVGSVFTYLFEVDLSDGLKGKEILYVANMTLTGALSLYAVGHMVRRLREARKVPEIQQKDEPNVREA